MLRSAAAPPPAAPPAASVASAAAAFPPRLRLLPPQPPQPVSHSREIRAGGLAGAVLPQVREGAGWREGGRRARGGREEEGEGGARAHLFWTAARAERRLARALRAEPRGGRAAGGGGPRGEGREGGGGGGRAAGSGLARSLWVSLPRAGRADTRLLPLTHSPSGSLSLSLPLSLTSIQFC